MKFIISSFSQRTAMFKKPFCVTILSLFALLLMPDMALAQSSDSRAWSHDTLLVIIGCLMVVIILVLLICIYVLYALYQIAEDEDSSEKASVARESLWTKLNHKFGSGKLLPVEKEEEIMLDHSYDGITELNNHMPPWLKYLFYATIVFAVAYVLHYMVLGTGKLQIQEYEEELAEAERLAGERSLLASNAIDEHNAVFLTDEVALEKGKALYVQNCAACHAADGGGTVGPNLTDEYWIHGGSVQDIFRVIKYGVQEKGMIPWQDKFTPEEIQNISSYILTLQGTSPANPKSPQGEKYEAEEPSEEALSAL